MSIFQIPSNNVNLLTRTVAKLNKRIDKMCARGHMTDIPNIKLTELSVETAIATTTDNRTLTYSVTDIEITGEVPNINGWEILAAVDHIEGFNIVKNFPGKEFDASFYRTRKPFCDHCNTHRLKKYSFVIRNVKTGEMKQVGKTCLKDFFDKDISAYVSCYSFFSDLEECLSDPDSEYNEFRCEDLRYNVRIGLAVAFKATRMFGYKKSSDERATKDSVYGFFFSSNIDEINALRADEEDYAAADKAIEWVKNTDSKNDFISTVKDLVAMRDVPVKYFGYVAGIVPFYTNSQKETVEVRNEWFGDEKKRMTMTLTLKSKTPMEGYYGMTYIHKFLDDKNRMVVWFASNDTDWNLNDTHTVKATVKFHDEYKGVKQTKVNRVTRTA